MSAGARGSRSHHARFAPPRAATTARTRDRASRRCAGRARRARCRRKRRAAFACRRSPRRPAASRPDRKKVPRYRQQVAERQRPVAASSSPHRYAIQVRQVNISAAGRQRWCPRVGAARRGCAFSRASGRPQRSARVRDVAEPRCVTRHLGRVDPHRGGRGGGTCACAVSCKTAPTARPRPASRRR
jgi:hypothetical protein